MIELLISLALLTGPSPRTELTVVPPTPPLPRLEANLSPRIERIRPAPKPPRFHLQPTPVKLDSTPRAPQRTTNIGKKVGRGLP